MKQQNTKMIIAVVLFAAAAVVVAWNMGLFKGSPKQDAANDTGEVTGDGAGDMTQGDVPGSGKIRGGEPTVPNF